MARDIALRADGVLIVLCGQAGIFYINPHKSTFEDNVGIYRQDNRPLFEREPDFARLQTLIDKFRTTG